MMYRKFYEVIRKWERDQEQKPLMVIGARQVGKTWLMKKFCQDVYHDYVYINLEERNDVASVFDGSLDPEIILMKISQLFGRTVDEKTPVFFDEIQCCERSVNSMKYFCESEKNYRILCAGSLLGVKIRRFHSSFPVGKVHIVQMYPLDFEEFLLACGEDLLRDGIRNAYMQKAPLAQGIHEKALHLYQDYLYVGGMPEAVQSYLDHGKNALAVDSVIYDNLQLAYLADMTKYVTSPQESVKITKVYHSVARQLAKENPKFQYSRVRSGGNRRDFSEPLDWLDASGMVYAVHSLEAPLPPLKSYEDDSSFKIYLSDVGLLRHMCGMHYRDLLMESQNIYKGAITENYVIQQLKAAGIRMYYYKPSPSMEIDLILDLAEQIIPVEIESGRHKRSTSLQNYRNKYYPAFAVRISALNFGWQDDLFSVPLYAVWCI